MGGQDWNVSKAGVAPAAALCGTSVMQSPIDIPASTTNGPVVVNTSLPALQVSYGKTASWTLEVTGAYNLRTRGCGAAFVPPC